MSAKKKERPETYPEYLRRVAADYRESGGGESPTADDYDESAKLIEDLAELVVRLHQARDDYSVVHDVSLNQEVIDLLKRVTR